MGNVPDRLPARLAARLPPAVRVDLERRTVLRAELRARRVAGRRRRRAARSASLWATVAAAMPAVAVVEDQWGWFLVGGAALARSALSWRQYRSAPAPPQPLPMPSVVPPQLRRRSAAAAPLHRAEAALLALRGLVAQLPSGPLAEQGRTAVLAAVETVDGLRAQAGRVAACENAARAVADPRRRQAIEAGMASLLTELHRGADGLDELLAAASETVVSTPGAPVVGVRLAEAIGALRALAEGLREVSGGPPGRTGPRPRRGHLPPA